MIISIFFPPSFFLQKFRQINYLVFLRFLVIGTQGRNFIPTPGWSMFWVGIKFLLPGWSIWRIFCYFCANFPWNWVAYDQFHEFFRHFDEFFGVFTKILKIREINYVFAIVCIWISFVSVLVLLLKFIRIGLLTNRLGRNKIPYHLGNYSFPCGFAARERIISLVVRNFIPTRAIGQESYIIHYSYLLKVINFVPLGHFCRQNKSYHDKTK